MIVTRKKYEELKKELDLEQMNRRLNTSSLNEKLLESDIAIGRLYEEITKLEERMEITDSELLNLKQENDVITEERNYLQKRLQEEEFKVMNLNWRIQSPNI